MCNKSVTELYSVNFCDYLYVTVLQYHGHIKSFDNGRADPSSLFFMGYPHIFILYKTYFINPKYTSDGSVKRTQQ